MVKQFQKILIVFLIASMLIGNFQAVLGAAVDSTYDTESSIEQEENCTEDNDNLNNNVDYQNKNAEDINTTNTEQIETLNSGNNENIENNENSLYVNPSINRRFVSYLINRIYRN